MLWDLGGTVNWSSTTGPADLPPSALPALLAHSMTADTVHLANMTTQVENYTWIGVVDTLILSLTVLGAMLILATTAWFEYHGRPSTTRMRIVQSLVVSDLVIGIVGLVGSALAFERKLLPGTVSCDGLGVMLVAVLWTEHLWTLTLALSTFFILIYPLHAITTWLEKFWAWLWAFVWTLAFGIAVMGYELYGYVPSGGICYYPSSSGLYGELIQFIPRGVVFLTIAFLYGRLFIFLRRPDKIKVSFSNTNGTGSGHFISSATPTRSHFFRLPFLGKKQSVSNAAGVPEKTRDYALDSLETTQDPLSTAAEIPPWEKLQLPAFQVDGQRFGGSTSKQGNTTLWSGWRGMKGRRENSVTSGHNATRSSVASSPHSSPRPGQSRVMGSISSVTGTQSIQRDRKDSRVLSPAIKLEPVLTSPTMSDPDPDDTPTPSSYPTLSARRRSGELSGSLSTLHAERLRRMSGQSPLETLSFGGEGRSNLNLTPDYSSDSRRPSAISDISTPSSSPASPSQSSPPDSATPLRSVAPPAQQIASFRTYRMQGSDEETGTHEDEMGFLDMLQHHQPPITEEDRFRPNTDGDIELVEESMASYLNRKTALLMLWFPLGYVLLFSISLVRIIYDFAGTPPTILRALSRWFIFAQGILDALIYGFVEWHTKRVVRRRVKRGHFSTPSQQGTGNSFNNLASALRTLGSGSKKPSSPLTTAVRSTHSPIQSFASPRPLQTVSFDPIEEERNILQQLYEDDSRKSSLPNSSLTAPVSIDGRDGLTGPYSESGKSSS